RYYAQDEIGTPWCVTIDFQTLEDDTVTVRDRDTMKQERIAAEDLTGYFSEKLRNEAQ
ncbi:MAG: glycine--tRNA ligase, partial [Candidatus Sungbacteria bacterium]|nr:glycine--tRNA ligase [Candidatus Sungbacteria bacterium]